MWVYLLIPTSDPPMSVVIYVATTWYVTASLSGWWSGCTIPTPHWTRFTAAVHPSTRGRGSMTFCRTPLTALHQVQRFSDGQILFIPLFASSYMYMFCTELMSRCCFLEFASYQSLKFESISVEAFTFGMDQYVVFAQPFAGTCNFLEWDHVEMTFRTYDTIESEFKSAAWICGTVLMLCLNYASSEPLSHNNGLEYLQNMTWLVSFVRHIHCCLQAHGDRQPPLRYCSPIV